MRTGGQTLAEVHLELVGRGVDGGGGGTPAQAEAPLADAGGGVAAGSKEGVGVQATGVAAPHVVGEDQDDIGRGDRGMKGHPDSAFGSSDCIPIGGWAFAMGDARGLVYAGGVTSSGGS